MKILRKSISILLILAMIASMGVLAVTVSAEETADASAGYCKGVYYYRPSTSELDARADAYDVYTYSDSDFLNSSKEYSHSLATTSMSLAVSSVSSTREPFTAEGYTRKNRNVIAFLEDCGFSDIAINDDYKRKPTKDSLGVACAHKTIKDGDTSYPLVVMMPRSAGYEKEWGNNFVLGASGDAKGFNDGAEKLLAFARDYISEQKITGDIKVWVVGYSRGAAIANLVGKKLIDSPEWYLGGKINLDPEDLYAYTFGTPSAAAVENNPRDPKYAGIFNSFSRTEISAAMAPVDMGFERYGTDLILEDDENYETVLKYLEICNPTIYNDYITTAGPKAFSPKKLSVIGENTGIVNDPDSYIPNSVSEYLAGLCTYLTQISGGRKTYAEKYEKGFSSLLGYYMSLTGENSGAFTSALTSNEDSLYLVAALYAYFMRTKRPLAIGISPTVATSLVSTLSLLFGRNDAEASGNSSTIAAVALRLMLYLSMSPERLRGIAAELLTTVLPPALEASGGDADEIAYFSDKAEMENLAHMLSFLLLGNIWQDDSVQPLNLANQQIKNAVTLIGNFNNYFYDHYNEIIISRLKTEDSRYEVAEVTDAQLKGYRRVYLSAEESYTASVLNAQGDCVATLSDGVLSGCTDAWVGFTATDDGGFLRIPAGEDYRIRVCSDAADNRIDVAVAEYDCYEATATQVFRESCTIGSDDVAELTLPAIPEEDAIPSTATYSLNVESGSVLLIGDADTDGTIAILDATAIQRYLAGLNPEPFSERAADADGDGSVTILDTTDLQRYLAGLSANEAIGQPIR